MFYVKIQVLFLLILTIVGAGIRNLEAKTTFVFYILAEQKYTQCGIIIRQDLLFYISHKNTILSFFEQNAQITKETIFGGSV